MSCSSEPGVCVEHQEPTGRQHAALVICHCCWHLALNPEHAMQPDCRFCHDLPCSQPFTNIAFFEHLLLCLCAFHQSFKQLKADSADSPLLIICLLLCCNWHLSVSSTCSRLPTRLACKDPLVGWTPSACDLLLPDHHYMA